MKYVIFIITLCSVLLLAVGCSDDDSNSPVGVTLAVADLDAINAAPDTLLRKTIGFTVEGGNPGYSFAKVFVTRSSERSQYGYGLIPITNNTGFTRCFIKMNGVSYYNSHGDTLDTCTNSYCLDFDYTEGIVQEFPLSNILTNTCLKPYQTGFVLFIENTPDKDFYNQVVGMRVSSITDHRDGFTDPDGVLAEQSAVYSSDSVAITVKNTGSKRVEEFLSSYILQDVDGGPALWGFLLSSSDIVDPGKTMTLTDRPWYGGIASRGISLLDWDYPDSQAKRMLSKAASDVSDDEAMRVLHKMRTEAEAQKASTKH